jgi:MFS family permease
MGTTMTGVSVIGVFCAFVGPMLSDRYGRKPVVFTAYAVSATGGALLALAGPSVPLVISGALLVAVGGAGTGALIMAIIPGESAPAHLKGTAMGFTAAIGELLGAGLFPIAFGSVADRAGMDILPWVLAGVAVLFCLLSLALNESAPQVVARRTSAAA